MLVNAENKTTMICSHEEATRATGWQKKLMTDGEKVVVHRGVSKFILSRFLPEKSCHRNSSF